MRRTAPLWGGPLFFQWSLPLSVPTEEPGDEGCDEQHQENKEQYPGDLDRPGDDPGEAEEGGYERDDQKNACILEHVISFGSDE